MSSSFDLGNIFGSLMSGLISSGSNAQGVLLSKEAQMDLMRKQAQINYQYYKRDLLHRYSYARKGLENGNYNPMLALQGINGNSSWAGQASINDTGAGASFNAGVSNANTVRQLMQQDEMNQSAIGVNNATEQLKTSQAMTEFFKQLDLQNTADLKHSQKVLTDKNSNNFEKFQAREDKKVALEAKRMQNDYKLGMLRYMTDKLNVEVNEANARTNAVNAVTRKYEAETNRGKRSIELGGSVGGKNGFNMHGSTSGYFPGSYNY